MMEPINEDDLEEARAYANAGPSLSRKTAGRLVATIEALRKRLTVTTDDEEHVFIEEEEPDGRLILPPCLLCGMSAMEALEKTGAERDTWVIDFCERNGIDPASLLFD